MVTSLEFFGHLRWIDGRPLLDTIEQYRRDLFTRALDSYRPDGSPAYNLVLAGRGKKNGKSLDLDLAALYCLIFRESPRGSDGYIVANDEEQAGNDLDLLKKLVAVNPDLGAEVEVYQKQIRRRDGGGTLRVLPARDTIGLHGITGGFLGYDEIHGQRNYDLFEALAPDPTRPDVLTWITSYDSIWDSPGIPLHDFKAIGKAGSDRRMLFSWYSGDLCTDPNFADLEPELRANPSIGSWPEGRAYLDQQRRRLPTHKFRRLHLNLPGSPNGAAFDQGAVLAAIVPGRHQFSFDGARPNLVAFVDMSGGSADEAVLGIAFFDELRRKAVLVHLVSQTGDPPFNPRHAIKKFVGVLRSYGLTSVTGDAYAGQTFRSDFSDFGISYEVSSLTKSELYDEFEPLLNAGEVELLDVPKLQEQLLTLVHRGSKIDHQPGDHDDFANAAVGAIYFVHPHDLSAGANVMEFYRRQSQVADHPLAPPEPPFGFTLRPADRSDEFVRLRAPGDVSTLFGITGRTYLVPADRIVVVHRDDAAHLRGAGWKFMDVEGVQM